VPPEEALDYFRRKSCGHSERVLSDESEARDAAFTVSGIYKKDILEAFKEEIAQGLETGATQKEIVKGLREILAGAGHKELGAFHLETVVRRTCNGRMEPEGDEELEAVQKYLPYWEYHAGDG